jgi:hypothetical protein
MLGNLHGVSFKKDTMISFDALFFIIRLYSSPNRHHKCSHVFHATSQRLLTEGQATLSYAPDILTLHYAHYTMRKLNDDRRKARCYGHSECFCQSENLERIMLPTPSLRSGRYTQLNSVMHYAAGIPRPRTSSSLTASPRSAYYTCKWGRLC